MKFLDLDSVLNSPDGFLHEWWSIFYEVFTSRQGKHQETGPEFSNQVITMIHLVLFCVVQFFILVIHSYHSFVNFQVPVMTDIPMNGIPFGTPQIPMNEQIPQQFQASSSFSNMMTHSASCLIPSTLYNRENLGYLPKSEPSFLDFIRATNPKFLPGSSSK